MSAFNALRGLTLGQRLLGAAALVLAGGLFAVPMALAALLGLLPALAFVHLCIRKPSWGFGVALIALILIPQYVILRLPSLPALPLSLGPLGVVLAVSAWRSLLIPSPSNAQASWIMSAYSLFGLALFCGLWVTGEKESLMLFIRTFLIPYCLVRLTLAHSPSSTQVQGFLVLLMLGACFAALFAGVEFALKRNVLLEKIVVQGNDPGMQEQMSQFYLGSSTFDGQAIIYRCFSVFTNPLEYGTFMTMLYPFALVQALSQVNPWARWGYRLAAGLCVLGILFSFSRGPILALVVSTLGMAFFLPAVRKLLGYAALACVLATAAAWPVIGERIQSRLKEVDNVTARFKLWNVGLYMFTDHPLWGVGLSRYAEEQNTTIRFNNLPPFTEYGGAIDKVGTVDQHFIQLAAETGLVGIGSYAALLVVFYLRLWRCWRLHPTPLGRHMAVALMAGVFNYLFNGLTISSYVLFVITLLFAVFLALGARLEAEVP